jgi:hypothetical protein
VFVQSDLPGAPKLELRYDTEVDLIGRGGFGSVFKAELIAHGSGVIGKGVNELVRDSTHPMARCGADTVAHETGRRESA